MLKFFYFCIAMKKILPLLFITLLFICCGQSNDEKQRLSKLEKRQLDSIDRASFKVAVMPTLDCLPLFVAKDKRLFDTLGVDVHLKMFDAQMDCDTALIGGSVEGSISDLFRVANLRKKGVSLGGEIATGTYWQLFTNRLSRIRELSQLSDKMIGMTRYSATDYLATLAIDSARPKYDVYRIQINNVKIRLAMLLNNEIDAELLTEPQATEARLNNHPVLMDTRDKDIRLGVFAFRSKALAQRKKQHDLFVKAYNMACDSINKYGVRHYSKEIKKYCGCEKKVIESLPVIKFAHADSPRFSDLKRIK